MTHELVPGRVPGEQLIATRPRRLLLGALLGLAVAAQFMYAVFDQWNHRTLIPGFAKTFVDIGNQLAGQMPWFQDLLLGWLPLIVFYLCLLAIMLYLARAYHVGKDRSSSVVPDRLERFLNCFLFAACTVGVNGTYRGISFPLAFVVSLVAVLAVCHEPEAVSRDLVAACADHATRVGREEYQLAVLRADRNSSLYHRRGDEVVKKYETGSLSSPAYLIERIFRPRVERIDPVRKAPALPAGAPMSAQELAVLLGPRADWWRNGLYALWLGSILAVPVVVYDGYLYYANGILAGAHTSRSGVFELINYVLSEASTWLGSAFVLGSMWSLLPSRRGFYKGFVLGLIAVGAALADWAVSLLVGQSAFYNLTSWPVLVVGYFVILGVIIDVSTLKKVERERWEFIDYLRLRDTRWIATYGATLFIVGSTILHQIQAGEPLTALPSSLTQVILNPGAAAK